MSYIGDIDDLERQDANTWEKSVSDPSYMGDIHDLKPSTPEEMDVIEKAKYPFLPEAAMHIRDQGFTIEQFGTDSDLKGIIGKAYQRIRIAADGKKYKSEEGKLDEEIFSFLMAVILLKQSGSGVLTSKFVMAESIRAERHLETDLANSRGRYAWRVIRMIENLFSVKVLRQGGDILIPVQDYVRRSVLFHEIPWKLVNRRVSNGKVLLTPREAARLVRPELNEYITKRIRSASTPQVLPNFEEPVRDLVSHARQFRTERVVSTEYPPCIKHAIKVLADGVNLPHSGRFMLASYLLSRGQTVEQVAPLFKNAPDYNERVTMYQLKQIAGKGEKGYTCPSCSKIKSNDLCFAIPACDGIVNPLQFGRRQVGA